MKYPVILALALLAVGCDGPKKPVAAPTSMASMEMPVSPPAAVSGPSVSLGAITISSPWAPVTPSGARVAAGYLTIKNTGATVDKLLSVTSARAKSVEIHEMVEEGGMMTMRQVPQLALKAGQEVEIAPGGLHLMMIDPVLPYVDGETIPVTLTFERAGKADVQLLVRPRDVAVDAHGAH